LEYQLAQARVRSNLVPGQGYEKRARHLEAELEEEDPERQTDHVAVPQAFMALDEMWCAVNPHAPGTEV
jgi:hypothetical protein